MINFRYHVVSLTAVFLALAIGLVVGTAALNGPAADALQNNVDALRKANHQLREQVSSLTDQANREDQFVTEAAPIMLEGKLAGRRVLVVSLPSGRDYVAGTRTMLALSGATVVGTVEIQDKFFDPDQNVALLDLESQAQPASVPNTVIPANSDGVETSSALLANIMLARPELVVPEGDLQTVLAAYTKAGYVSVEGSVVTQADAVVFVSGAPAVDSEAGGKNVAIVTTVAQFSAVGPTVVGGMLGGEGNLVAEVRADATLATTISTVDNTATAQGQVAVALSVADQLGKQTVGHYGTSAGSLLPQDPQ